MENNNENPNYYAIIPANVRYDKTLCPNAKLLFGEITALCSKEGYCWAKNDYFADIYGTSKKTISRWINALKDRGYIDVYMIYKEKSREIDKRIIIISNKYPIDENVSTPIDKKKDTSLEDEKDVNISSDNPMDKKVETFRQKSVYPMDKKVKDNNININNTINNNNIYSQVINYLNQKTSKKFKSGNQKTREKIIARVNNGYTLEDFKKVIDIKSSQWLNDKQMCKYLRPETLFGNKFEGYLNEYIEPNYAEQDDCISEYREMERRFNGK